MHQKLILLITLRASLAISVWVLSYQRETTQLEADAELRWEIYNNAWNKTVAAAEAEISQYGPFGERCNSGDSKMRSTHFLKRIGAAV